MLSKLEVICQDKEIEGCLVIFAKNISPSCKPLGSLYSNYMLLSVHHSRGVERKRIQDYQLLFTGIGIFTKYKIIGCTVSLLQHLLIGHPHHCFD